MTYQHVLRRLIPSETNDPEQVMWRYRCPNPTCPCRDPESHKHFYLDTEEGMGYCFRCRKGMSLVRFLALTLNVSREYAQFYAYGDRELVLQASGGIEENRRRGRLSREEGIIPGMQLPQYIRSAVGHPYLKKRGIGDKLAQEKGLCYCERGDFAHRIIVPLILEGGKVVGFSGRSTRDSTPKNLYPTGFPKRRVVYNEPALTGDWAVLVEGELGDAFSVMRVTPFVGALYGNRIHALQAMRLAQRGIRRIWWMIDGKEDPLPGATTLSMMGFEVRIVEVPPALDPGAMSPLEVQRALNSARLFALRRLE